MSDIKPRPFIGDKLKPTDGMLFFLNIGLDANNEHLFLGDIGHCFHVSGLAFAGFPSDHPKQDRGNSEDDGKSSRNRFPVFFNKVSSTGPGPSQRAYDEGNASFRLIIGTLVIGLFYALLKRIGKKDSSTCKNAANRGEQP